MDKPEVLRYKYSTHAFHVETFDGKTFVIENEAGNADRIRDLIAKGQVKSMHTDNPTLGQVFLKVTGKELV
ncbi:hypothetical protein [Evansella tamaricis]|uniref:hypothetical protein n=1 Tax=Evansella tamaricis TaxID=2069301 RepID=UPI0031B7FA68